MSGNPPSVPIEAVQRGQRAAWGDFEDRAVAVRPTSLRCPVEVPIGGLDQPRGGVVAVRATVAKLCSVVSVPLGVILKTVPPPLAPPVDVVP